MKQALKHLVKRPNWNALSRRITYEEKQRIFQLCGYNPFEAQQKVHRSMARFKGVAAGRRLGKTTGIATFECIPVLCLGGLVHNVAPDYPTASILFTSILQRLIDSPLNELIIDANVAEGKQAIWLTTGGVLEAKSSSSLNRGKGPDLTWFDESSFEPNPDPWRFAMRPALMDHMGGAGFTYTPKGHDWNKDNWELGQDDVNDEWESWQISSYENPLLAATGEIDAFCEDASQEEIDQEIWAKFIDAVGSVFRGYGDASTALVQSGPIDGHTYVIGVDPAISHDFCGICVFDITAGCWAMWDRFNKVDWDAIRDRVVQLSEEWGYCGVIVDATNQSAFAHQLTQEINWATVVPFTFTAVSKSQIIKEYALGIAKKEVRLPLREQPKAIGSYEVDPEVIKIAKIVHSEHGWFRYELNPITRHVKMQAPVGKTDDMVCAGALAYHMALHHLCEAPRPNVKEESDDDPTAILVAQFARQDKPRSDTNFKGPSGGRFGFTKR